MQYKFKHNFVLLSVIGATLVGSINSQLRILGFALCVIGNIYWIWYHGNITKDIETQIIFAAYLVINSLAIINNYLGGYFVAF